MMKDRTMNRLRRSRGVLVETRNCCVLDYNKRLFPPPKKLLRTYYNKRRNCCVLDDNARPRHFINNINMLRPSLTIPRSPSADSRALQIRFLSLWNYTVLTSIFVFLVFYFYFVTSREQARLPQLPPPPAPYTGGRSGTSPHNGGTSLSPSSAPETAPGTLYRQWRCRLLLRPSTAIPERMVDQQHAQVLAATLQVELAKFPKRAGHVEVAVAGAPRPPDRAGAPPVTVLQDNRKNREAVDCEYSLVLQLTQVDLDPMGFGEEERQDIVLPEREQKRAEARKKAQRGGESAGAGVGYGKMTMVVMGD